MNVIHVPVNRGCMLLGEDKSNPLHHADPRKDFHRGIKKVPKKVPAENRV